MQRSIPLLTVFFLFTPVSLLTQNIEWEENYGGSDNEGIRSIDRTDDGGYVAVGISRSSSGDVSDNNGGMDYLVTKVDSNGNLEWEKNYGGSWHERGQSIQQIDDGGYIVAGFSASDDIDVSGNKGSDDYWILELSPSGTIEWEQNYGGGGSDQAVSIRQTSDQGFIVGGETGSSGGDVSANNGDEDYWLLRLDEFGNIEWEQNLGGSGIDEAHSLRIANGGGFIIVGGSWSSDQDVSGNYGSQDVWVAKTSSLGFIDWQQNFGGSDYDEARTVRNTNDGGYIVAGNSESSDGDLSGNNGLDDYWAIKLDGSGNLEWQQHYGNSDGDLCRSVVQTADGGFLFAGGSQDTVSTVDDQWLIKTDASGNVEWDQRYGGSGIDVAYDVQQTSDGGYITGGETFSDDGDVSGPYEGGGDFWMVKLGDQPVSLPSKKKSASLDLYPNPTQGVLHFRSSESKKKLRVRVRDINGRTVAERKVRNTRSFKMELEGKPGLYLIDIRTADGERIVRKVLKE